MSSQSGNSHEFIAFLEEDLMLSQELNSPTEMDVSLLNTEDVSMNLEDVTMLTAMDADFDDLPFPSQIPVAEVEEDLDEVEELDDDLFDEILIEEDYDLFDGDLVQDHDFLIEQIDLVQEHDLIEEECDEFFEFELDMTLTQKATESAKALPDEPLQFTGFTTGKGRVLPPPSEESIKRAKRLVEDLPEEAKTLNEEMPPNFVGFSTGKGKAMPPPSRAAIERAQNMIADAVVESKTSSFIPTFSTGTGKTIPPPSKEAMERALSFGSSNSAAQSKKNNENLLPKQALTSATALKRRTWKQPRQITPKPVIEATKKSPPVAALFELKSLQSRLKMAEYFAPCRPSGHASEIYSQFGM
jgi:hypothetical protein